MRFGCHLSIRNGYLGAAQQAYAMNAGAFQYFPKNPRNLTVKDFSKEDAARCKEFCLEKGLVSVSHSPYPTNLTPQNETKREHVVQSLLNDLEISEACGSLGVVVHFGKPVAQLTLLDCYRLMIDVLNEILYIWEGDAKILLENNAGIPGTMGTTLEEHVHVRNLCDYPEKIGFCLDTCHAFASGLWDGDNWRDLAEKGTDLGYFQELQVIHFNNSKYGTREGKDRHAPIFGKGCIKEEQFDDLIQSTQAAGVPLILETPKEEMPHEKEIQLLLRKWSQK
ncbi:deoxyribonuclease IV [Siminovitchia sediminis]|uniref:Deoxyribonuclease IV n=1 Tax=Siminovitchia sediminis TaxID=1274353 RepID=A0ABW4KH99_9BACI